MSSKVATPVVVGQDGKRHEPIADNAVLAASAIPVSPGRGNLLQVGDDGLSVSADSLISQTRGNPLSQGADGGVYLDSAALIAEGDKVLRADGQLLGTQLDLRFDQPTSRLTLVGVGNQAIGSVQLPVAAGVFTAAEVLEGFSPPSGGAEGTYLHFQFEATDGNIKDLYINVSDLVDAYAAGNGVSVDDNVVSVAVDPSGILGFTGDGKLKVAVSALVSSDALNGLSLGSDGKLFSAVTPAMLGPGLKIDDGRIVPDLAGTLAVGADGKIGVDAEALAQALAVGVSADEGNILMEGSDGRAYLPNDLGSL